MTNPRALKLSRVEVFRGLVSSLFILLTRSYPLKRYPDKRKKKKKLSEAVLNLKTVVLEAKSLKVSDAYSNMFEDKPPAASVVGCLIYIALKLDSGSPAVHYALKWTFSIY